MTGWPAGLMQDDSRELSRALAGKPDAAMHAREAAAAIRCPNANTEPCGCHGRGKVSEADLDARNAEVEADLRAAVCEVYDPQEPIAPEAQDLPLTFRTLLIAAAVVAAVVGCNVVANRGEPSSQPTALRITT